MGRVLASLFPQTSFDSLLERSDQMKNYRQDAVFFKWLKTSIRLFVSGSQNFLGKIGLIFKLFCVPI